MSKVIEYTKLGLLTCIGYRDDEIRANLRVDLRVILTFMNQEPSVLGGSTGPG